MRPSLVSCASPIRISTVPGLIAPSVSPIFESFGLIDASRPGPSFTPTSHTVSVAIVLSHSALRTSARRTTSWSLYRFFPSSVLRAACRADGVTGRAVDGPAETNSQPSSPADIFGTVPRTVTAWPLASPLSRLMSAGSVLPRLACKKLDLNLPGSLYPSRSREK